MRQDNKNIVYLKETYLYNTHIAQRVGNPRMKLALQIPLVKDQG